MKTLVEEQLVRLADNNTLAQKIWSYYIETLRTDGQLEKNDRTYDWDKIDEIHRRNFLDAVRVYVCAPALKMIDALSDEQGARSVDCKEANVGQGQTRDPSTSACYICAMRRATAFVAGVPVCPTCSWRGDG